MDARIRKSELSGRVVAPPSKSYTQRAVVCALIADGKTEIVNPSRSEDALFALRAARMLGARVTDFDDRFSISGGRIEVPEDVVDCGGSATALRFFTAVSSHADGATVLTGDDQLRRRPMGDLLKAMNSLGAKCFSTKSNGFPPVVVMGGGMEGGTAAIPGDVSSQFISSLLVSSTLARNDTAIRLSSALESKNYIDMTMEILHKFGAKVAFDPGRGEFSVPSRQILHPLSYHVEGDFSSAAFMLAAGILCGKVLVDGIQLPSLQGDSAAIEILQRMGAKISCSGNTVTAETSVLRGIEIDARQIPDLVPILAAVASRAEGETRITGIKRLRYKESDRIATIAETAMRMGGRIETGENEMVINGVGMTKGAIIDPSNDHRIAMACSILALFSEGETIIKNAECVSKSYPSFFEDLVRMGGKVEMIK